MGCFELDIGATPVSEGVRFRVWAPAVTSLQLELVDAGALRIPLQKNGEYFQVIVPAAVGDRYWYWLDETVRRPDPASRSQPDGVHGPSQVIDPTFAWNDREWNGRTLNECIFYELHVGAFTLEGTFSAAIQQLDYLTELGVTAIELMPVAQFPGTRNWGYDGVFPFAPQQSYGGPAGLKQFVDACHRKGLAVILDVVYNHLGPEGNYLHAFGPYFTNRYQTPWGDAVNFDGPFSDGVRHFFIANACHWVCEYHLDGLRLDAVHGIFDFSAKHILAEISNAVHKLAGGMGRPIYVIAESDLNDPRLVTDISHGGDGLDAQWCDDFHHALHTLLTGECDGYYQDFGEFSQLVTAFRAGFVYAGNYSRYRRRSHGSTAAHLPPDRFLVCIQNHDQVGNRPRGDRLAAQLPPEQLRLAAAAVLFSPYLPLLFMGEEYGETAPFPYFISHGDPTLIEAVRQGRQDEFSHFTQCAEIPDPQSEATFLSAKIDPAKRHGGINRHIFAFTQELIRLRKSFLPLAGLSRQNVFVHEMPDARVLLVHRHGVSTETLCVFNFSNRTEEIRIPFAHGPLRLILDASDQHWGGMGTPDTPHYLDQQKAMSLRLSPWSVLLYAGEAATVGGQDRLDAVKEAL
jgi:maltooligosyltrehalose trehalohydrolase